MTLDEVKARFPLPSGLEWVERGVGRWEALSTAGERVRIHWIPQDGYRIEVEAYGAESLRYGVEPENLAATYHHSLVAAGLLSPWTTTIPTEPGYYLVWCVEGLPPEVWVLTEDGEWIDAEERVYLTWPDGCQFLPCPMPGV